MKRENIGGQAVIEGVMMRSQQIIATAVRRANGEIVYKKTNISNNNKKLAEIPFIRGIIMLFTALVMGVKELTFSANQASESEEEEITDKEAILSTVLSLSIGIALFVLLPSFLGSLLFPINKLHANIFEGILRLIIFITYVWAISISKDVRRVYEYHGAEHKCIYAYEQGIELTPENAKKFTTLHPRCGTSFLLIVIILTIIIFLFTDLLIAKTFLAKYQNIMVARVGIKLVLRILLMPLVAGIAYEIQRYSSHHLNNIFIKGLALPGLWLQKITTKEPSLEQLEVAIVAIKVSLGENVENAVEIKN